MTDEEKKYVDDLIMNALTVNSDEKEGQQVIDLNSLNLCAVDYVKGETPSAAKIDLGLNNPGNPSVATDMDMLKQLYTDKTFIKLLLAEPDELLNISNELEIKNNIILEFADSYINDPNPVNYKIYVNPGDLISEDTIIGQVEQHGQMKDIKSIFSTGVVAGTDDNTDFLRLYPSKCNRHIIIENTEPETGEHYNLSVELQDINNKFTNEGILYALITNNMCQSLLPYVLSRRYRGVYTRDRLFNNDIASYSKWYLDSSDLIIDNIDISTFIKNNDFKNNKQYDTELFVFDIENENYNTGVTIYDSSILQIVEDIQDDFGSQVISKDITKADMKRWRKKAKKKKNRKKVKQEINEKVTNSVDNIKHSDNPSSVLETEQNRLLDARAKYINDIIDLYNSKDKLPLCKYDPYYTDCKFLINDNIDSNVLKNVNNQNEDFTYTSMGDNDNYYNYYFSLLSNINLMVNNEYVDEYYQLITDIINKRIIIEGTELKDIKRMFINLFNDNISDNVFHIYKNENFNTIQYINQQFNKFENMIEIFVKEQNSKHTENVKNSFTNMEVADKAVLNAGNIYTDSNKYQQIYDFINNLYLQHHEDSTEESNTIISQLSTMYMYIKSYGDGKNNIYKDLKTEDNKYLYYELVKEEAQKITDFWDKIIDVYNQCKLDKCITDLNDIAQKYDNYAEWPLPTFITINNKDYTHYLFQNIYDSSLSDSQDISIGDYTFPDKVEFPEIPEDTSVSEEWVLNEFSNPEILEPDNVGVPTIKDTDYWKRYFTLATLICLVPLFWNCGLDLGIINFIPMPCIFIAIKAIYIPVIDMIIVIGLSVRGMYVYPIILYINASSKPLSVLTPLVFVINRIMNLFDNKIKDIYKIQLKSIVNYYKDKLVTEINDIKKENIKLDNFIRVIKHMKIPEAESIKQEFALMVDPSVDTRQKIMRLESLVRRQRVY